MKKKALKLVIFLVVALVIFLGLSEGSKNISCISLASIRGFYTEPEDSLDVVLIGASEVYAGYSPTEAWKAQGYTSYDFASEGVPGNLYKSMLKEVIRKQNPKVVVFEINGFLYDEDYFERSGSLHRYIDSMKISKNWVETIKENIPEEQQKDYFLPICTYHDNWKDPVNSIGSVGTKAFIKWKNRSNLKGLAPSTVRRNTKKKLNKVQNIVLTDKSRACLKELCETCQEIDVEQVLFVRFPHLRKVGDLDVYPEIEQIVESYGYDFLNLTDYETLGLDKDLDYYDADHMNYYGMKKFTGFFSEYLADHYELPTEHNDQIKEAWNASAEEADEIFARCEMDMEEGKRTRYTEMSCYFDTNLLLQK